MPLPLNSKEFVKMLKAVCTKCNYEIPLQVLAVHIYSCSGTNNYSDSSSGGIMNYGNPRYEGRWEQRTQLDAKPFSKRFAAMTETKKPSPECSLHVSFVGEAGLDTGALRKEFLTEMISGIEKRFIESGLDKKGKNPIYSVNDLDHSYFRTDEHGHFDGVFLSKDEDVSTFVDYVHKKTKHTIQKIRDETDSLENMKTELGYTDDVLQQSVTDVQQWAACDSNKRRHRIRRKILDEKRKFSEAIAEYNDLVPDSDRIDSLDEILAAESHVWPWELHGSETAVGLYTKKRVFNKVMLLRRLHEEEVILVRELKQHWQYLRRSAGTLRDFASQLSDDLSRHIIQKLVYLSMKGCPLGLAEEGYSGLHCVVQRRISELKSHQDNVRDTYSRIIGLDATILDEDIENEDFESSQYDSTGEERGTIAELTVCLASLDVYFK
ncbi:UNVERIFIED_CONTAM: hypothetical protein FKN15_039747 [Acipenser sinensis]